jgi:hypothetical protein
MPSCGAEGAQVADAYERLRCGETEFEDLGAAGIAVRRRGTAREALLTDCSQTVRIHLDVPAHVGGKGAGQAHNAGHVCTSWDRLVGFKSRHPDQSSRSCGSTWAYTAVARSRE